MKCQDLFSLKKKMKCCLLQILFGALRFHTVTEDTDRFFENKLHHTRALACDPDQNLAVSGCDRKGMLKSPMISVLKKRP